MARMTLLEMTQNILSSMSSDEVNSISDTTESLQVAQIIVNKYYDIASRGDLPEHTQLFQLTASTDSTKPVLMYVPDGVSKMEWTKYFDTSVNDNANQDQYDHDVNTDIVIPNAWSSLSTTSVLIGLGTKTFTVSAGLPVVLGQTVLAVTGTSNMFGTVTSYSGTTLVLNIVNTVGAGTFNSWVIGTSQSNSVTGYKYVTILPTEQYIDMVNGFNPTDTDVSSFVFTENGESFTFYYKTDRQPEYCTVISNYYIIFDSFDNTQDTTLQASKTLCFGQIVPSFALVDSSIPDVDDQQFPLLLNEAKALAFYELKQMPHAKAEQEIKRQWSAVQRDKAIVNRPTYFNQLANFGRLPRTGGYGAGAPIYSWMRSR